MSLNSGEYLSNPEQDYTKEDLDKVVSILMRSFGTTVDSEVIRGVAVFCKGNLTRSIEFLMKQTANQNMPPQPNNEPFDQRKPRNRGPNKIPLKNFNMSPELGRIINDVNKGYKVLIFMRGLPGSGKSTLAQFIFRETVNQNVASHICSSDDYFYKNGKYCYDVNKLGDAHAWNQNRVRAYISQDISPIIVDNTNLELWEMQVYASAGVASGYMIEVVEPRTPWAFKPAELAKKNSHGVMLHIIKRKLEKYQGGITGPSLLKFLNMRYSPGNAPPKMRLFPKMIMQAHSPMTVDVVAQPSNSKMPAQDADLIFWDSENLKTESVSPKTDQQAAQLNQSKNKIEGLANFSTSSQSIESSVYDSYEKICQLFAQPKDGSNPTNSTTLSCKSSYDAGNTSSVVFNGPVKIATAQNEVIPLPKPQRTVDSKPSRIQNKNTSSDSVDWEPIDVSLSNWDNSNKPITQSIIHSKSDTKIESPNRILSSDVSTNTQSFDLNPANWNNFKVLTARNRNINEFYVPILQSLPPKFGLDKSTMIFYDDEMSSIEQSFDDKLDQLRQLRKLFPDVPLEDIRHILSKCKGDVNWAVDLLLDDKTERGAMDIDVQSAVENDSDLASFENINNFAEESVLTDFTELMEPVIDYNNISPIQNGIKNVKLQKKDKVISETSVSLKKQLEENFDFADNYYSNHVFKLKNKIHKGKYPSKYSDAVDSNEEAIEESSNSNEGTPSELSDDIEVIEDVVSINMGEEFIDQMDQMFGTNIKQHEKLKPIIHMPISLANQMYALWMESVFNQLDVQREFSKAMIKEDEEFARLVEGLEQDHQSQGKTPEVPNLQEIMDMEMTLAAYKTNMSRWIEETPNTMALKLTRLKLCQLFPDVGKEILLEVLNAYNNDFEQTVQVLLVSLGKISMSDASEMDSTAIQKLLANQEKDLLERANEEKEKVMMLNTGPECSAMGDNERISEMDEMSSIAYLRKHAEHHLIIRNKNHQKAQEYFAKGMPQAASYYSQMATLHSKKLEIANNRAAMGIIQATSTHQNDFTLDLHHLYLAEAMQALDLFIDKHISRLIDDPNRSRGKSIELYLITGRGKHSPGGIPKIKNGTQKRLDERKIKWTKVTDGSLKLTLNSQNMMTPAINMLKNNSGHG